MAGLPKRFTSQGITIEQFFFQFVVVLLGVYLAILFEGKAEDRSRAEEARSMLSNILGEMELDEAEMERVLIVQHELEEAFGTLADLLVSASAAEEPAIDSIMKGPITQNPTVFPRRSAYSTLVASGNIGYLPSSDLVLDLANFYEHEYVRLTNAGEWVDDSHTDFFPLIMAEYWNGAHGRLVRRGADANVAFWNKANGWSTIHGIYQRHVERALTELRAVKARVETSLGEYAFFARSSFPSQERCLNGAHIAVTPVSGLLP